MSYLSVPFKSSVINFFCEGKEKALFREIFILDDRTMVRIFASNHKMGIYEEEEEHEEGERPGERRVGVQSVEGKYESRQLPGRPKQGRRGGDGLCTRECQAKVGLP